MGPIETNLVITPLEVQTWLGLDDLPDLTTGIWKMIYTTAKQLADLYCNNPFTDPDDAETVLIPDAVKNGVLQIMTDLYNDWQNSSGGSDSTTGVIKKEKTGDMEVEYATPDQVKGSTNSLSQFAQSILDMYRLMPL